MLDSHINKLGLDKRFTICNQQEVARKLCEVYGHNKAQQLLGFILLQQLLGFEAMKQLPKSTYDRRIKDFSKLGLAPIFSMKELPHWI